MQQQYQSAYQDATPGLTTKEIAMTDTEKTTQPALRPVAQISVGRVLGTLAVDEKGQQNLLLTLLNVEGKTFTTLFSVLDALAIRELLSTFIDGAKQFRGLTDPKGQAGQEQEDR
jgi:hypothetical protein